MKILYKETLSKMKILYKETLTIKNMFDAQLRKTNPWWTKRDAITKDKQIQEWQKSSIRYDPPLRHNIRYDFEYDNTVVYTLRGLR